MDNLEYSIDAKNILDEFYSVDRILYVEGIDDKAFWSTLFEEFYSGSVEIIEVNGVENIKKYIHLIESNQITNSYVACDQDYNYFINKSWGDRVICTYGHSIENSLIYKDSVIDLVKGYAKFHKKNIIGARFDNWINDFHSQIGDLIYCDIYNEKNKIGHAILGDSCDRYFVNKKSYSISTEVIYEHISKFFDLHTLDIIREEISIHGRLVFDNFIRGHFLYSAIMRFVTLLSSELAKKKISIPKDSFFASIFISFEKNLKVHPHREYYQNRIESLL